MIQSASGHFKCPNCHALYQLVKAEAGPETISGEIACCICGRPLPAREGNFILKYFLLRPANRRRKSKRDLPAAAP
jgi:hypothetical protein